MKSISSVVVLVLTLATGISKADVTEEFRSDMKMMNSVYSLLKTSIDVSLTSIDEDNMVYREAYSISINGNKQVYYKNHDHEFIYKDGKTLLFSEPLKLVKFDSVGEINPLSSIWMLDSVMLFYSDIAIIQNTQERKTYKLTPRFGMLSSIEISIHPQTFHLQRVKMLGSEDSGIKSSEVKYSYRKYNEIPSFRKFIVYDKSRGWTLRQEYKQYTFQNNLKFY